MEGLLWNQELHCFQVRCNVTIGKLLQKTFQYDPLVFLLPSTALHSCRIHYTIYKGQWCKSLTFLASMMFQQPENSQRKWTKEEWTQPTQQTTQCSTVEGWKLCLVAERPRVWIRTEIFFEAVSYCDLAQNLEKVQFLISKKGLNVKLWWISHCSQGQIKLLVFFFFSFVGKPDDWHRPAIRATVRFLQVKSLFCTHSPFFSTYMSCLPFGSLSFN